MANGFPIPNMGSPVKYEPFVDPAAVLKQMAATSNMLARASRGAGGGGRTLGAGQMVPHAVPDPSSPTGYRVEYAPKGVTAKEREQIAEAQQQYVAANALQSDPTIAAKLAQMQQVPVSERSKILDDIRQNDVARLTRATGLPSGELFNAMLQGVQSDIAAQTKQIQGASSFLDPLAIGASTAISHLGATFSAEGAEKRIARAREHAAYVQQETEKNAYLREREAQKAAGMGPIARIMSPTGTLLGEVASAAGEMLPAAGAIIGGGSAGTRVGSLAGPWGALAGAIVGAGTAMASMAPQAAVERIAADPNLSESEKLAAADRVLLPSAGVGFLEGAVGAALPVAVSTAGRALVGGATGAAAAPGALARIMRPIAETPSMLGRYAKGTALTASELAAMNLVGVPGQNLAYSAATGQPVDISQGLSQTLEESLFAAPFFGLTRVGRGPARRPAPAAEPSTPAPAPVGPTGEAVSAARQQVGQARRTLREQLSEGAGLDPEAYIQALREQGWTEQQFSDLFEQPGVTGRNRLDASTVRVLRDAHARGSMPAGDAAFDVFRQEIRPRDFDTDSMSAAIDRLEQSGMTLEDISARIEAAGKERRGTSNYIAAAKRSNLNEIIRSRIEAREGATPDVTESTPAEQPGAESGRVSEAPAVGPDAAVREATAPPTDIPGDIRVEADTTATPSAAAGERPAEPSVGDRTVEGGGAGRPAESNIRPSETVVVSGQAAGTEPGVGADPRPSVVPTTPADAAAGPRPGEPVSPAVGTASRAGATEAARPAERAPVTREQIAVRLGRSDAKVTSPTGELLTVSRDAAGWNVASGEAGTKLVSGERTRSAAVERAKDLAVERANRPAESAPEAPLPPEISARAAQEAGITPEMSRFNENFQIPGEVLPPTEFPARSPEAISARVAELPAAEMEKVFGRRVEGFMGPQDRAMALLFKEVLDPSSVTKREKQDLTFLHKTMGVEKMEAPQDVVTAYTAAEQAGIKPNPVEIAKALNESAETYKKLIDRWACGA